MLTLAAVRASSVSHTESEELTGWLEWNQPENHLRCVLPVVKLDLLGLERPVI